MGSSRGPKSNTQKAPYRLGIEKLECKGGCSGILEMKSELVELLWILRYKRCVPNTLIIRDVPKPTLGIWTSGELKLWVWVDEIKVLDWFKLFGAIDKKPYLDVIYLIGVLIHLYWGCRQVIEWSIARGLTEAYSSLFNYFMLN